MNIPPAGDGLRLAALMDIFAPKINSENTINRIENLEQIVQQINAVSKKVEGLENITARVNEKVGSLESTTAQVN